MRNYLAVGLYAWMGSWFTSDLWAVPPTRADVSAAQSGAILLAGGGATPDEVYETFFQLAGGASAHLVHIPTATESFEAIPDKGDYYATWTRRPKQSFCFVHTRRREEAETAAFSAPLLRATGVWIGGGDQYRLAETYRETPVTTALHDVLRRGGVVAGTSAGAMILSEVMVSEETDRSLAVAFGFKLLPQTIVDSHLTERGRARRLLRMVHEFPRFCGIGIDERTALVLQRGKAMALGEGQVVFFAHEPATNRIAYASLRAGESRELSKLRPAMPLAAEPTSATTHASE